MGNDKLSHVKKHDGREDLTGEHSLGDLGQIILLIFFLIAWVIDSFVINYSTFLSQYIPLLVRIPLSVIILFCAGYIARSGLKLVFGEKRDEPSVIKGSVFSIVRHPIYLSAILLYLGLLILTFSIIATFLWGLIVLFYYYLSKYEERLLIQRFGKEYEDYIKAVPMLIPRMWRNEKGD
ncbi:methyltransferase family protein [Bacteroidota bacterium]